MKKEEVKAINDYIKQLSEDEKRNIKNISISAYASPDGATDYIAKTLKSAKTEADVVTTSTPEDWEGFKNAIDKSDIQDKDLILRVLSLYSDPDVREKEIKNLSSVYKVLANEILPGLRRSTITVNGELIGKSDDELKAANPSELTREEVLHLGTLYEGDPAKQKEVYAAGANTYSDDYRMVNNEGVAAYEQGDKSAAKAKFEAAEKLKTAPEVENNLGVIALSEGDLNTAKEYFGKAAGAGDALNENLGIVAICEGDYDKAETYFGSSTSTNAALVKILNGKYDAALSNLNANTDETGLKYYLKAIAYAHKDDKSAALENLSKATKLESKWKDYAKKDMEFNKYFSDSNFKSIVE